MDMSLFMVRFLRLNVGQATYPIQRCALHSGRIYIRARLYSHSEHIESEAKWQYSL